MQQSLVDRITGVVKFNAPTYKEIAEDNASTQQAGIVVAAVSALVGLANGVFNGNLIVSLLISVITGLLGWVVGGWLMSFIATKFFQGKTNTNEMLRVLGFSRVWGILGIIPAIGPLVGGVLGAVSSVIGIREAAEVDNTKAILIAVVAFVVVFAISTVLGAVVVVAGLATGAIGK